MKTLNAKSIVIVGLLMLATLPLRAEIAERHDAMRNAASADCCAEVRNQMQAECNECQKSDADKKEISRTTVPRGPRGK